MPNLPAANTTVSEQPNALASGADLIAVISPVATSPDTTPRVVSSTQALLSQYGYAQGVDYCAHHFNDTGLPVLFVGVPITNAGTIGSLDNTGVTGTSAITVTADVNGVLEEVFASVTVTAGGTVGTAGILLSLSLDGGVTSSVIRLGTATTYTIPYVGLVLNFGSGTLNVNDVVTFRSKSPTASTAAITAARIALAAQQSITRTWLVIGDDSSTSDTFATTVNAEANNFATANARYVMARTYIADVLPLAKKSKPVVTSAAGASLTFAATGHTITRGAGSFITEGFAVGQMVTGNSPLNTGVLGEITVLTATVMTFASGLTNEGPITTASLQGTEALTWAASGFTITRTLGSWLNDGFAVGMSVVTTGSTSNNDTLVITALTATVMTFAAGVVNEGPLPSSTVSIVQSETYTAHVSAASAAYASIAASPRANISYGRARGVASFITGSQHRRPAAWLASLREYQHDVQTATYRKADGPLGGGGGWQLTDTNGNIVEYDERTVGGALAGLFTCLRTWGNGPRGAFVALDLTRDNDNAFLSRSQNEAVANVAEQVIQSTTEEAIGELLILNSDGTGTDASLAVIEGKVNDALQLNLLQDDGDGEGPAASMAVWTASRTDVLSSPGSILHGTCVLEVNGTLEQISTTLSVS